MKKLLPALCIVVSFSANAADSGNLKLLWEGMSEGQVLAKVGKPDSETVSRDVNIRGTQVKQWIYLPKPGDPQITTTVTFVNQQVSAVKREESR